MAVTSKGRKDVGGSNLTGPEKAAIFLLTVGEEFTSQVFKRLAPEEIKLVGRQMAKVDKIDKEELEALLQEFKSDVGGADLFLSGNDLLEHALRNALSGDKANEILEDIRSDWKLTLFQKARKLEPKILVNFLRNEHPQTVALVLSVLEPNQAAQVVAELPEATQVEVVMRMAELDKVGPEILVDVDRVLQDELLAVEGMEGQRLGGVDSVAELLNNAERAMEAAILEGVEEQNEAMAEEIRRLMFVFEDLLSVDDRGIQAILKEVSTDDLKVALKISSDELKEKIFGSMSSRAVELLKDDMEIMGPTRIKDVEAAQQAVIKVAKRLEQEGKVQLMVGAGEDEFV
ncbi:flagellar motor switch protein FliG [Desulfurivibrio dismutans]|uniref:flagellar motor switch protein FliG n=1 Tax=Desulfurivibrio dismutans TaxID=1398908 RepID=UPI0023DB32D3|nr:flagellar motor switch protein FliG [Desulfurivibrio alkaliphilus]MDF1614664.1 flagellar motor switch protein FliG [Desulfurivibrio alkaliphilus]